MSSIPFVEGLALGLQRFGQGRQEGGDVVFRNDADLRAEAFLRRRRIGAAGKDRKGRLHIAVYFFSCAAQADGADLLGRTRRGTAGNMQLGQVRRVDAAAAQGLDCAQPHAVGIAQVSPCPLR